jgi:ADP-ribosylglycohydrolase
MLVSVTQAPTLSAQSPVDIKAKTEGLLLGSYIGDALGGPIEFQGHPEIQATPQPPKLWKKGELLNKEEIQAARNRIHFREYKYLRPLPEPYAHWTSNAAPGTITDDSRHKLILLDFLKTSHSRNLWPVDETDLGKTYLNWNQSATIKNHSGYDTLCQQWLNESYKAIHWMLGSREPGKAYPLERLWNALPTCYGQMALLPLAALYPGEPEKAYLSAYQLAYFDNAFAKDMNAGLVAGLSKALSLNPTTMSDRQLWQEIISTMKSVDPFKYLEVPWSERASYKWLQLSEQFADSARNSPALLFEILENEFKYTVKWEAQVPFVVMFSCLRLADYDPLAALELSIEWGWDHDSYAQLMGAFIGALYGKDLFTSNWQNLVTKRLELDYDVKLKEQVDLLVQIREIGRTRALTEFRK